MKQESELLRPGSLDGLRLRTRVWIVDEEGRIIMGEGRKAILDNIDKTGSINQTAKLMKMSYKAVWGKIKATEKTLQIRIVHTDRKTGTHLTPAGRELLERYRRLKENCLAEEDRIFECLFK